MRAAEEAILDVLLDNKLLKLSKKDLLENKVHRTRSAKNFFDKHMRLSFSEKVYIYRILDSKRESFTIPKKIEREYRGKFEVKNVITAPEIEILVIISEGQYSKYQKSKLKPSEYCKQILKIQKIKEYKYVYEYFSDISRLLDAITKYRELVKKDSEYQMLYDLLDNKFKN